MRLVDMRPKDIYCYYEISVIDVKKLIFALDNATINLDLKDPEQIKVDKYIKDVLYPELKETMKRAENNGT